MCYLFRIGPRQLDGVTIPEWRAMLDLVDELGRRNRR